MKRRESWADLCKWIGIVFMVWGHAGVSTEVDIYLHSFHMPIFFFLSGYWFTAGKYGLRDFLKRRARSLLIPYFFYGAVLCILWNGYSLLFSPDQFVPWDKIARSLFLFNADFSPFAAIQWFLTALFLSEILFFFLERVFPQKKWSPAVIALLVSLPGYFWLSWDLGRIVWSMDCAFTGTAFYAFGYFLKICLRKRTEWFSGTAAAPFAAFGLLLIGFWLSCQNGYTNMRVLLYGNYFLYYASALATICGIALLSMWTEKKGLLKNKLGNFLLYMGKNTLVILVLNQAIRQVLENILHMGLWISALSPEAALWVRGAEAAIVLLIGAVLSVAVNRFLPFTVGKEFQKQKKRKSPEPTG